MKEERKIIGTFLVSAFDNGDVSVTNMPQNPSDFFFYRMTMVKAEMMILSDFYKKAQANEKKE